MVTLQVRRKPPSQASTTPVTAEDEYPVEALATQGADDALADSVG
jgi:hypothetical protein